MNAIRAALALAALTSALVVAMPAFSVSVYCDNDRDASQYPCSNILPPLWSYGHWSGDWNGDDRRTSSATLNYGWVFNNWREYNFYVWLANPDFTDTYSLYGYWHSNGSWVAINRLNQNTAPSGWSNIGRRSSNALAVWHDNHTTGADIIRGDYDSALANEQRSSIEDIDQSGYCGQLFNQDRRITVIQKKMLNAIEYYNDARGSFRIAFVNNGQNDAVDFEVSPQNKSSVVRITSDDGEVVEHMTNGQSTIALYPNQSAFVKRQRAQLSRPSWPRYYYNQECEAVYVHRQDPTGSVGADEVLLPQNYAFWLTNSNSTIVGHEKLLGRKATVILGHHERYLSDKLGASTFKMWVDDETGVLLKLTGTNEAGQGAYYIDVHDLKFNSGIDLHPSTAAPVGWRQLDPTR